MSETNPPVRQAYSRRKPQQGVAAVEFALVSLLFFTLLFGVIEVARLVFLLNTLQEVTRRAASAAATTDFSNSAAMDRVRWHAIFRDSAGGLTLMKELTDQAIRIDYLSIKRNTDGTLTTVPIPTGSLPASPVENRKVCLIDPYSSTCIRVVRARVCDPSNSTDCQRVQFKTLATLVNLTVPLTVSTTLAKAQSLGIGSPGGG